MEYGKAFYQLCEKLNIGKYTFCDTQKEMCFEISFNEFFKLNELGIVYNGSMGGLVLGKSHKEGGVHFLI